MPPEIKILLYMFFIFFLFFIHSSTVFLFIFLIIFIFLLEIPLRILKKGWLPITLFISFTFLSNVFFHYGRIIYSTGPFVITDEGLQIAFIRTMRIFFMIAGAKILAATTEIDSLVSALGNILKPLERIGVPVSEFFHTMGLTMKSLPKLKDHIKKAYRESMKDETGKGFWNRIKFISMFLLTLLVKNLQSPEIFFEDDRKTK